MVLKRVDKRILIEPIIISLESLDKVLSGTLFKEIIMARLSDTEITQLKIEVSLHDLVKSFGIALKRHGKDYLGHCPFHDDKTPSLVISPDKNLWHCLGACIAGGDVIQWVMKREGLAFREAVAWLRSDSVEDDKKPDSKSQSKPDPILVETNS